MRDPKRIKRILNLIEEVWEEVPDWRLTQLIMNSLTMDTDPFYIEDGVLEDSLKKLKEKLK